MTDETPAPVSALKDAEEVVTELRSLKSALIIASVDLTDAEERREQENRFAALVDYTNDMQAQLARANAVIERVGAAVQWALRQIENPPETHWPQGEGYEGMNYGLGHARGALIEAFNDDDLRTILEGASNE